MNDLSTSGASNHTNMKQTEPWHLDTGALRRRQSSDRQPKKIWTIWSNRYGSSQQRAVGSGSRSHSIAKLGAKG